MTHKIDRRAMLAYSAATGAAMAGFFGAPTEAVAGQAPATQQGRMRRVVTGNNAQGKSYITSDEVVAAGTLWTTKPEQPLGQMSQGEAQKLTRATGDTRFFVATIQPSKDPKPSLQNRIGFHQAAGIAYCYILNGEIVFMTDTQEVIVRAGDLIIERNTLHSWRNEGTSPVAMLITVVSAT